MPEEISPFLDSTNASSKEIGTFSEELNAFLLGLRRIQRYRNGCMLQKKSLM